MVKLKILITLKGRLKGIGSITEDSEEFVLSTGVEKIADVLEKIKIPRENIGLIVINKKVAYLNSLVGDGDVITFYPPIAGG